MGSRVRRLGLSDLVSDADRRGRTGAALLLVWPRTAAYGAMLIIVVMLGGMGTHVFVERRPSRVTSELAQLTFLPIVLAGRWRRRITLSGR